jgi:hypothetical protein
MTDTAGHRISPAWLLPLAALAAGYVAGHLRRGADAMPASSEIAATSLATMPAKPAHPPHAIAQAATNPQRRALPPMPAADAPLAESFEALAERARNGDGAAAVRLADATLHCEHRNAASGFVAAIEAHPSKNGDVTARMRRAEKARAFLAETQALCAGATREQTAGAGEWIERAAASGDAASQACYASIGASEPWLPEYASDAWIDAMRRYRENARAYAESALAAGVPQAASALYEMTAGRYAIVPYLGDGSIAPDYARAYALARLQAARIGATAEPGSDEAHEAADWRVRAKLLEHELSDTDIERAKRWADAEASDVARRGAPALPCDDWVSS